MALFELSNSSFVMVKKKIEIVIFFNCQLRKIVREMNAFHILTLTIYIPKYFV